jgi:hypothetical protein
MLSCWWSCYRRGYRQLSDAFVGICVKGLYFWSNSSMFIWLIFQLLGIYVLYTAVILYVRLPLYMYVVHLWVWWKRKWCCSCCRPHFWFATWHFDTIEMGVDGHRRLPSSRGLLSHLLYNISCKCDEIALKE